MVDSSPAEEGGELCTAGVNFLSFFFFFALVGGRRKGGRWCGVTSQAAFGLGHKRSDRMLLRKGTQRSLPKICLQGRVKGVGSSPTF